MPWPQVRFGNLYESPSRNGLNRPRSTRGSGFKMINMGEIFAYDRIGGIPMERVQLSQSEMDRFSVKPFDLMFARQSMVAEGAGKCSIVTAVPELTCFESHLIRVRLNEQITDPRFYFYYFRSPSGRPKVEAIITGAAQKGIRGSELEEIEVDHPPLIKQRRIVSILSAYDDLIENNTRRIAILEEMARRIYEEWFVRFRFPGHEKVRMKESELGVVPEGWEIRSLGDIAAINAKSIRAGNAPREILYIDIASVTPGVIEQKQPYSFDDAPGRARRVVAHGDVIWSCVRPNRRSYALVLNPEPALIASTGFAVLSAVEVPYSWLYFSVTTDAFVAYLTNHATGAAYPAVTAAVFESAPTLLPDSIVLQEFHAIIEPMLLLCESLKRKNANLRTTRDLLLPKLISGELDVSHLPEPEAMAA